MKRIAIASDRQIPQRSVFPYLQDYTNEAYVNAIIQAGAFPYLIPYAEPTFAENMLEGFDGLLLPGGNDITPIIYGEERKEVSINCDEKLDRFQMALINAARKKGIPILGICRGFQLLNIALGGTLYQDLLTERDSSLNHSQKDKPTEVAHQVQLREGSILYTLLKEKHLGVNSLHHQGIKALGFGLEASAYAPDGLIEAFEGEGVYGVQWHPEAMPERMKALFSGFLGLIKNE